MKERDKKKKREKTRRYFNMCPGEDGDFSSDMFDMDDDDLFEGTGEPEKPDAAIAVKNSFSGGGGGKRKPPSEKQIKFVEAIANVTGEELPEGYKSDWKIAADFIDKNKDAFYKMAPPREATPPSEKQLNFARMIADGLGKTVPDGIENDWRIAKDFIDSNKSIWEKNSSKSTKKRN